MNAAGQTVVALISRTLNMQYLVEAMHSAFAAQGLPVELRLVDVDGGPAALGDGAQVDLAVCWEPYQGMWPQTPRCPSTCRWRAFATPTWPAPWPPTSRGR